MRNRRSPGLAFWVSLIIPGGGEIYCGKRIRGISSLGFTAVALAGVILINPSNPWWGVSLRTLTALYIFSFIDAYYTALENNCGKEPGPYQNPRVAAVLNLLTHGFGYFYLGERGKGLLVFLGLRFVAAALGRAPWVMEFVLLGIAIDAYRIGRREILKPGATPMMSSSGLTLLGLTDEPRHHATPAAEPSTVPPVAERKGLPESIPLAFASILGLLYGGTVLLGAIMPNYQVLDQSRASFSQTGEEKIYSNPRYGVTMHIPASWSFANPGGGYLIQAASTGGACRAGLALDSLSPFKGLESRKELILAEIQRVNPEARLVGQRQSKLGVRSGYELTFSHLEGGYEILTRFVFARKGMTLFSLILTNPAPFDEDCRRLTDAIRVRLVLSED